MQTVDLYRDDLLITTLKPDNASALSKRIMGENQVRIIFDASQRTDFKLGDRISIFDEYYFLTSVVPTETKEAKNYYRYDLIFESSICKLRDIQYLFLGNDNTLKEAEFDLHGTAETFLNLLIQNLQRLQPDYYFTKFEVKQTNFKTITFSGVNCLEALNMIAEAFELEYYVKGSEISITQWNQDTGYTFRQGQSKGIYTITKKQVDDTNLITRIYPFGGKDNLPENYRNGSQRLKMSPLPRPIVSNVTIHRINVAANFHYEIDWTPPNVPGATGVRVISRTYNVVTRRFGQWGNPQDFPLNGPITYTTSGINLRIQFQFITLLSGGAIGETSGTTFYPLWARFEIVDTGGIPDLTPTGQNDDDPRLPLPVTEVFYLEKNIEKYGVHEMTYFFDDIYPHRTGTITAVDASNIFKFKDSSIDFDLNDHLLGGATPKITFNTGQLAGWIFEIVEFDNTDKEFTIVRNKDEKVLDIPNDNLKPAVGDQYVLTDIKQPQSYIDAAEQELKDTAQAVLNQFSEPQVTLTMELDPKYIKDNKLTLDIGMLIWVEDEDLQIRKKMRLTGFTREILDEYNYKIELSDVLTKSTYSQLISGQANLTTAVNNIRSGLQNTSILNNRVVGPLVIAPDGYITFEDLQAKSGLTLLGIDAQGRLFKVT